MVVCVCGGGGGGMGEMSGGSESLRLSSDATEKVDRRASHIVE